MCTRHRILHGLEARRPAVRQSIPQAPCDTRHRVRTGSHSLGSGSAAPRRPRAIGMNPLRQRSGGQVQQLLRVDLGPSSVDQLEKFLGEPVPCLLEVRLREGLLAVLERQLQACLVVRAHRTTEEVAAVVHVAKPRRGECSWPAGRPAHGSARTKNVRRTPSHGIVPHWCHAARHAARSTPNRPAHALGCLALSEKHAPANDCCPNLLMDQNRRTEGWDPGT